MRKFIGITIAIVLLATAGYFTFLDNATYSEGVRRGGIDKI